MVEMLSLKRFSHAEAQSILLNYQKYSSENLNRLFLEGKTPTFEDIAGETAGVIITCPQCGWFSKFLATVFFNSPFSRWTGKIFVRPFEKDKTGKAVNRYSSRFAPRRYPMLTSLVKATCDQKPCVKLTYTFPWSMFGARDEFRKVEDGVFLGQTYQKLPFSKAAKLVAHFVLCPLRTY